MSAPTPGRAALGAGGRDGSAVKPIYERAGVAVYCADFRDVLPSLPPADMLLTDPPYGETSLAWDRWLDGWPSLLPAALAETGSLWCFGSFRMFFERAAEFAGWHFVQDVVWEKHNGSSFHADRFKRVHELVAQFIPNGARWSSVYKDPQFTLDATARTLRRKRRPPHMGHIEAGAYASEDGGPKLMRSELYARSCHGYAIHETQKPLGILQPLIEYSCPPGGLVIDPFMGSGAILEAARLLGRRAIGIEINPEMAARAASRLAETLPLGALA